VQFTKLRLSGFKSFVDQTELLIEPGMTGVVGPNGCGKSNLLEALRWVMGETSAKRMRGADMDDVIFGGTATRPPRHVCEVGLVLDNSGRTAPAGLNDADVLEISRRLERGAGSDYKVNGKGVRARDVQLLFADNASGANSPALVSQGRVGALINAKPGDRRLLLEEAAGISGLHARRHEAELRLRAAETNLTRLDDVLGTMDTQLQGLRRQARQAARYRNLQEHIRRAEAILLHLKWTQVEDQLSRARDGFEQAENAVRALMLAVTQFTTRRTMAAADVQPKRQVEAAAAAALQRLVLAREQLDGEERRAKEAVAQLQRRLAQIDGDLSREKSLALDARAALERLAEERQILTEATADEEMAREEAEGAVLEMKDLVEGIDRELARAMDALAAEEAKRGTLERQVRDLETRAATLRRRLEEQQTLRDALHREIEGAGALAEAEEAMAGAEERLDMAKAEAEEAEAAKTAADRQMEEVRSTGQTAQARARDELARQDAACAKVRAEVDALRSVLRAGTPGDHAPVLDSLTVAPGYEAALAAALGDDLSAAIEEAAPIHWRRLDALPDVAPLPYGAEPLSDHVTAPPHLARCLAHVGVVEDAVAGDRATLELLPGQIVVTRFGGAWRWDGLVVRAGAPTAAAQRLKQRNRLGELEIELAAVEERALTAKAVFEDARMEAERTLSGARAAQDQAAIRDRAAREAVRTAFTAAAKARDLHAKLAQAAAAAGSRLQALTDAVAALTEDRRQAEEEWAEARAALEELPDPAEGRSGIADLRARLGEARAALSDRQNALDRLVRDAEGRRRRLSAIAQEEASWTARLAGTDGRLRELEERALETREEMERLAERPSEIEGERLILLEKISEAERTRRRAADDLAELESHLNEVERGLRAAESKLADAREARAHAEAAVSAALQARQTIQERVTERLDCTPDRILAVAEIAPGEEMPDAPAVEARLERLTAERENMGPVNMRAEVEVTEMEAQIGVMMSEREDLLAAIARLRQGIASLNREARERLLASFTKVDGHFQEMFTKLFGGGKAHLKLTEAEDPLDAGLEIYASPPGKKLQVLSLLSGGEQALTALALIFAVFICNPAPICVLDEVDAPLDEANVGRFCDLVEEMARAAYTRFLIVTHHRLTMARMDRLFGVTMAERGISQLVSVDLAMVEDLRGAA
jgi:chromosome segregation protein